MNRESLIRQILAPADETYKWRLAVEKMPNSAFANISRISAETEEEEALIIAIKLRETLEHHGKTAILVSNNNSLCNHVRAIMGFYGIAIDDSTGITLTNTPPAIFLYLLAEMAINGAEAHSFLAFCKHPLFFGGKNRGENLKYIREIEIKILRNIRPDIGIKSYNINIDLSDGAKNLLRILQDLFAELEEIFLTRKTVNFSDMLSLHIAVAEKLSDNLWHKEAGNTLAKSLSNILQYSDILGKILPSNYLAILKQLLSTDNIRANYGSHPRIKILSPQEARLEKADLVILASLNEGSWPKDPPIDAWISRPMREKLGLNTNDMNIALASHDFEILAMTDEIFLIRAEKSGGSPTIANRWWRSLDVWLNAKAEVKSNMDKEARYFKKMAKNLTNITNVQIIVKPHPKPPVNTRPKHLYVTDIEKLIDDPYSIYAKKILGLKALKPIASDIDARHFGNAIHKMMEVFINKYPEFLPHNIEDELLKIGKKTFADILRYPTVKAFWWTDLEAIITWIAAEETSRRIKNFKAFAEKKFSYDINILRGKFKISAKIDRIEVRDNIAKIIDYKTGKPPNIADILAGRSLQLPLSAIIFYENEKIPVHFIEYWQLKNNDCKITEIKDGKIGRVEINFTELIENTLQKVQELFDKYDDFNTPYIANYAGKYAKYSDYSHLSRINEQS